MPEETNKKLDYLKREEVRTMEKDTARLRERESETARERIAQIKTGEEAGRGTERLEQFKTAVQEREKMEMEAKVKEEELKRLKLEREKKEALLGKEEVRREESEKEKLRTQLREAQLKEEEERKKFLKNVAAKAGEPEVEEWPVSPPIPPPIPVPPPTPPAPPIPTIPVPPVPPPIIPLPADLPAEVPQSGTKEGKKPFKFRLPSFKISWPKTPPIRWPKVKLPKIEGYFPKRPSALEKIWIRIVVSLFLLAILSTIITFWYWYLVAREETPEPKQAVEITEKEITAPLPLIPAENEETLEITASAELPNLLLQILQRDLGGEENKFTRLLVKNTSENRFLGLKEFFEAFRVKTPENFYNNIDNDFTLFVFSSLPAEASAKAGTVKNQLGFIAKTQNPAVLRSIMESWEETLEKDTEGLFLLLGKKGAAESLFQKSSYKDAVIHYLSFQGENFGICWAITDNYFIFTSSGESIVKTLNKIKE